MSNEKSGSPPPQFQPTGIDQQQVSEQPLAQAPMTATSGGPGGNRNAKNLPIGPDGVREWSSGLLDCCDDPEKTVLAWFCPCIVYSQNRQRHTHLVNHGAPDPNHGGSVPNTNCMMYGGVQSFCCAGWLLQINVSSVVRQRYNIRGNPMKDVCTAACCIPCDLVRQSREIELEEQSLGQKRI